MKRIAVFSIVLLLAGLSFAQTTISGRALALLRVPRPLVGVTVSLYSPIAMRPGPVQTAVTGNLGGFRFTNVEPGVYSLVATARGFHQPRSVQVTIPRANPTSRVIADVYLVPDRVEPATLANAAPRAE